jgi:hypothetical protein
MNKTEQQVMQIRDARVLKIAKKFLAILRGHTSYPEALDALRVAERMFAHPLSIKKD